MAPVGDDEEAWEDHLFFRVIRDIEEPAALLAEAVAILDSTPEPDVDLIGSVGAGALETLVRNHGTELWEEIERLARDNVRFRRALRSVWAYDSPEYERRSQLLEELGEFWPVELSFIVEPYDLPGGTRLEWRARQVRGAITPNELARILREIADNVERTRPEAAEPSEPDGPTGTVEELAEMMVARYGAEDVGILVAPGRDDMCLILLSLPEGRTLQLLATDDAGWEMRTLRPVQHWLPYDESPRSDFGVFTERDDGSAPAWTPPRSDGVSRSTLGSAAFVSFWGVGRDEGLERFRALRRQARP
ncbi:MAG: hypothetical protein QOH36_1391 [Actinomycetota bacterium]|nr:hypothetical protein [Actinomycetota bacterium]